MSLLALIGGPSLSAQQTETSNKAVVKLVQPITERFEISVHYSSWSLNLIKATFEEELVDSISRRIRSEIANQARAVAPFLVRTDFNHSLGFDSSGSNYGVEIRFYPKGRGGSFSLGFTLEKTSMTMAIQGPIRPDFADGTYAEAEATGTLKLSPFSTHLNFRWDMVPKWIVSPYLVFGLGLAPLSGDVSYEFGGTYHWSGPTHTVEDYDAKSIKEAEELIDFNIPSILVVFQLAFGIRADIASHFVLLAEAGVWDGIMLRGGLGIRF